MTPLRLTRVYLFNVQQGTDNLFYLHCCDFIQLQHQGNQMYSLSVVNVYLCVGASPYKCEGRSGF